MDSSVDPQLGDEVIRVNLIRTPLLSGGVMSVLFLGLLFGVSLARDVLTHVHENAPAPQTHASAAALGFLVVLIAALLFWRIYVRTRPLAPIELHERHVVLPLHGESLRRCTIAYKDILAITSIGYGAQARLLIEARQRLFLFPSFLFAQANGIDLVLGEIKARLARMADGAEIAARMERRRVVAAHLLAQTPWATWSVVGLVVVFFANQVLTTSTQSVLELIGWGAHVPLLVRAGQWYRPLASAFLSDNLVQAAFALLAFYTLGALLERLIGAARLVALYVAGLMLAGGLTAWSSAVTLVVGCSPGVWTLLGAWLVLHWRYRLELPLGFRQPLRWWLFMGMLALSAPLLTAGVAVDWRAHAAAFAFGVAAAAVWSWPKNRLMPAPPPKMAVQVVAGALALAVVASLIFAVKSAAQASEGEQLQVAELLLDSPTTAPEALASIAWAWGGDAEASPAQLQLGERLAQRGVEGQAADPLAYHTLALLQLRNDHCDAALASQVKALAGRSSSEFAAQLARILAACPAAPNPTALDLDRVRLGWRKDGAAGGKKIFITLDVDTPVTQVVDVFGVAKAGQHRLGLVRVRIDQPGQFEFLPQAWRELTTWGEEVEINVMLAQVHLPEAPAGVVASGTPTAAAASTAGQSGAPRDASRWAFWPLDPQRQE